MLLKTKYPKLSTKALRIKIYETFSFTVRQKQIFTKCVFTFLNRDTRQSSFDCDCQSLPQIYLKIYDTTYANWYHFVQFKKREKHSWRSVTFSKVADLSNCTNIFSNICDTSHDLIRLVPFKKHEKHP